MVETVIEHPELAGVKVLMGEALIQLVQLQPSNPTTAAHPPTHPPTVFFLHSLCPVRPFNLTSHTLPASLCSLSDSLGHLNEKLNYILQYAHFQKKKSRPQDHLLEADTSHP